MVEIDLSDYFKEFMFVGFSESTEGSTEIHMIKYWNFETSGFYPVRRPKSSIPHNVYDHTILVISITPAVLNSSSKNNWKKLGLGLAIAGPGLFCIVLVVFGFIFVKKFKE